MKAVVFPGQGSQYSGMGREFLENDIALKYFDIAKKILGFDILDVMVNGSEDDLKKTRVTQPAVFLHSIIRYILLGDAHRISAYAGHSLGEITALVAAGVLNFEDGLSLVLKRALAMQDACDRQKSGMAAVLGLDDLSVEQACHTFHKKVVPANYNAPGQVVISGLDSAIKEAADKLRKMGAKRVVPLKVNGAFHSPYMNPASEELNITIDALKFSIPSKPIYQNFDANPQKDPYIISDNLKKQLISPVKWTYTIKNMVKDGMVHFIEVGGKGNILGGLIRKIDRAVDTSHC